MSLCQIHQHGQEPVTMPCHRRVRQCRVGLCSSRPVDTLVFALTNLRLPGIGTAWRGTSTSIMFLSCSEAGVINIACLNLFKDVDDSRPGIRESHNSKPDRFFYFIVLRVCLPGCLHMSSRNVFLRRCIFKKLRAEYIQAVFFIHQYFIRWCLVILLCENNIGGLFIRISLLKITACNR